MDKPKMIIFDAGKMLLNHLDVDMLRGICAHMNYATENPGNLFIVWALFSQTIGLRL